MKKIFPFPRRKQTDFDSLVRPHLDMLYRVAFRFCQQQQDAEDLVQDLLTKLYPRCADMADMNNLKGWLTTSLYHLFIDNQRKNKRSPLQLVDDETQFYENTATAEAGPQQQLIRERRLGQIQRTFNQLSDEHRGLLALHDIEGYRLSELQEMLDLPLGTLKSRIHRARARMRELLRVNPTEYPTSGNLLATKRVQ